MSGNLFEMAMQGSTTLCLPQRVLIGVDQTQYTGANGASAAISGANTAYLIPFWLPRSCKLKGISVYIGGSAGTIDLGVYYDLGNNGVTAGRIFSGGATGTSGNAVNTFLVPGITLAGGNQRYFAVFTGSTVTTLSFWGQASNPALRLVVNGVFQVAGAGPALGTSLTLANLTNPVHLPLLAIDLAPV